MNGVLTGFAIIGVVIAVGYALGRFGVIPQEGRLVLNRAAFFAATPAMLFVTVSRADLAVLVSPVLFVCAISFLVVTTTYAIISRLWLTRSPGRLWIGAYSSAYSNANNIGLPVAVYIIGNPTYVAPLLVFQVLVAAPILLIALDLLTTGKVTLRSILTQPLRNPLLLGSAAGAVVALAGVEIPVPIMAPLELLGGAAVPMVLLAFGISLAGEKPFQAGSGRREIALATAAKAILMPATAFVLAQFVFGLPPEMVYGCTILGALPTAQNMYQYALRYDVGTTLARDVVFASTFASLPVMLAIAALLH